MVSALNSGASGPGSSPGWGHCVVFLGKTLYSHSASLHPGVYCKWVPANCWRNLIKLRGVTFDGLASHPGEVKSLSNKLQKLQNRAARFLTFSSYDTSANPHFEQINWKWLDTQRQIQVATMVYKSIHGLAPDYLGSLFTKYHLII